MFQFERVINVIDAHTAGEPIRIVTSGIPKIEGKTILEKKEFFAKNLDHLRSFLTKEPRGHKDMFGAILTTPESEDGDIGVLFFHNEGMSTMCGHGTIGITKVAAETGIITVHEGENIIKIDAPAGRVTAKAFVENKRVKSVAFTNVPSFLFKKEVSIHLDGFGEIKAAISYAGAFYIMVEQEKIGVTVCPEQCALIVERAMALKNWLNANMEIAHPEHPEINDIYGVIVMAPVEKTAYGCKSRQACVFADGAVDRSPCGTGTSARMALLYANGALKVGEQFRAASIINTEFTGTVLKEVQAAGMTAIIPQIAGPAWITGFTQFVLDSEDPLPEGFLL